jgi:lysophospholipase L1-like esterase
VSNPQPAKDSSLSTALTGNAVETTFYLDRSALSYGVFETEATSLILEVSNTLPENFSDLADISVGKGTDIKTYKVGPGTSSVVHSMPPGEKRLTITSGGQVKFNNEIVGVFIEKITFQGSALPVKLDEKRLIVYGDSITVGGNVDTPSAQAWPVLLRRHFTVLVEAYGYRALYDDAATAEVRSGFTSKISSGMPDYVWLAVGANDYRFERWPAREFGAAYAATLDDIHASSSQAILYAQSPILRADESVNVFGNTPQDYRQQIETACLTRSAWCVFVDGTDPAFPQPDELDQDGIHLTTESSAKYAEAVLQLLGK